MKIIRPATINASNLTATNVPESAPAEYNAAATYALGATVSVTTGTTSVVYQSLQAGNTGNTPDTATAWWVYLATTYSEYSAAATYGLGDTVISAVTAPTYRAYQSLSAGNMGNALTNAAKWLDLGPTNRYRMFDQSNGTTTVSNYGLDFSVAITGRADGLALLGITGDSARITYTVSGDPHTNFLLWSESFDNGVWTGAVTVTPNAAIAPNSLETADLIAGTGTGVSRLVQGVSFAAADAYISYYIKAGTSTTAYIGDSNIGLIAYFDLSAQTATNVVGTQATITDAGDGWFRCSAKYQPVAGTANCVIGPGIAYNDTVSTSIYVWGGQLETNSVSAYIPTTSAAVSVLGETVYDNTFSLISDSAIQSWYDYFSADIEYIPDLILADLPINTNPTVRVRLTSAAGPVAIGSAVIGQTRDLGNVVYGARIGIQDYSRKVVDDFGNYSIVERAYSKRAAYKLVIDNAQVDSLSTLLAQYRATPVVWVGTDEYTATTIFGFFKDFAVELVMMEKSYLTLELEGLT